MPSKERYDRSDIRRMNAVSVLNQLRLHGSLSRANIAMKLGLTRATVSSIVSDLIDATLVNETKFVEGAAGRPGLLLSLNPNCGCMIAVEVDLDCISIVLTNVGQALIWQEEIALALDASASETLGRAEKLVSKAIAIGVEKGLVCFGICVAWAGLVKREDGELAYGPTSGWSHIPLKSDWEKRFDVPIYVENEAHAGAIGAHHFGETRGVKNLIYVSAGVGLAAGVFVDGVLLRGKQGYAGQVGHTLFARNGIACSCGKQGCWVTEVGANAILRKLSDSGIEMPHAVRSGIDWLDFVHGKAVAGDERILAVLNDVGQQLGQGMARLVQAFNPSVVILGGRLGKLMCLVEPAIREALLRETLPYMAEDIRFIVSGSDKDQQTGCLATVYDAIMQNPIVGGNSQRIARI